MSSFNDERVRAIVLGARAFRTIPFPAQANADNGIEVAVRCLSESELDACRIEAQRELRDRAKTRAWDPASTADVDPDLLTRLIERQVVWRAFYDTATIGSETPSPFFPTPRDVETLDSTTTTNLMHAYLEHQEWINPRAGLSDEEVDSLVDALGKAQSVPVLLARYERGTLLRFVTSMGRRLMR
jgi:hypothetical protein